MWGWFVGFGNFISGLLGIFCAWKLILICLNTTLNMKILYETFGISFRILAGLFSGLTHYIMHKTHANKYTKLNETELQEISNTQPNIHDTPNKQNNKNMNHSGTYEIHNIYPQLPQNTYFKIKRTTSLNKI